MIFQGAGPLPPPLDPRVASLKELHDTNSIDASSVRLGSYCLVIGDTLGVSKNAMSRVVHLVSKAFCAMGSCIIPNFGCEGSLYNVASTYKIPNYTHSLSHTVCGDQK